MGTRMLARRTFQRTILSGADDVLAGFWLPAKTKVHRTQGYVSMHSSSAMAIGQALMAAVEIWVLPVEDPDSVGTMEVVWDLFVPKDTAANVLDLDTATQDTTPFFEPGEVMWEAIFDIGAQPTRLFHHHFMSTAALNSVAVNRDPETPFLYEFIPGKSFRIGAGPFSVDRPSLLVMGGASPALDATSASAALAALSEEDWGQVQFIDHVLERAQLALLGLVEAGAETPWEEAAILLRQYLDPLVLEETASSFASFNLNAFGEMQALIEVQGTMPKQVITTGR